MNVEKATTYAFRVAGVTEAGRGEFSKWKTKDMPPLPITGMRTYLNLENFMESYLRKQTSCMTLRADIF